MRTREEIEKDVSEFTADSFKGDQQLLEVLLDIRELLLAQEKK